MKLVSALTTPFVRLSPSLTSHAQEEHHIPPRVRVMFSALASFAKIVGFAGDSSSRAETSLQDGQQNTSPLLLLRGCRVISPHREQVARERVAGREVAVIGGQLSVISCQLVSWSVVSCQLSVISYQDCGIGDASCESHESLPFDFSEKPTSKIYCLFHYKHRPEGCRQAIQLLGKNLRDVFAN